MDSSSVIIRLLHSVPHLNTTLQPVNSTFNPSDVNYKISLGILASIPAALLIISLVGLLLYLLTRCCDRKPRKSKSIGCQKCTLFTVTLLCCAAIGLGLYGNDDFHNGLLQVIGSGRQVERLIQNFRNETEWLKQNLKIKMNIAINDLSDTLDKPASDFNAVNYLMDATKEVRNNTTLAVNALETVLYFIRPSTSEITLKTLLDNVDLYETIRWPSTLGFLTFLLLLCTILMIGVARSSRCALIFFSVMGLLGVTICWLLSGIYLSSSVAMADFCMNPNEFLCSQQKLKDVHYLNCGSFGTSRFILRLNESRDNVDRAKESLHNIRRMSNDIFPKMDVGSKIARIQTELEKNQKALTELSAMLDRRTVQHHYATATKGLCTGGLFGLALMMIASLFTALFLTILVCVDSHTWIYLTNKRPYIDKSEIQPFLTTTTASSISPTAPISSGTSTINRTLLHHQQSTSSNTVSIPSNIGSSGGGGGGRNGSIELRGLAIPIPITTSGESPPPDYNFVVHGIRNSGHQTLGRLPSQTQSQSGYLSGPNNGKYATLSKQCKTLESNDCY